MLQVSSVLGNIVHEFDIISMRINMLLMKSNIISHPISRDLLFYGVCHQEMLLESRNQCSHNSGYSCKIKVKSYQFNNILYRIHKVNVKEIVLI